jgi:hypothetical protein
MHLHARARPWRRPKIGSQRQLDFAAYSSIFLTFSDMFVRPVLRWWGRTFPPVLGDTDIFLGPRARPLDWCPSGSCGR